MESPQRPSSTTTVFLDQPPSCLQFCPATPNQFVVGTYLLSESKDADGSIQQTKTGSLQLWQLNPETDTLTQIQRLPLPHAVFDLHFHPRDPSLLAIATSAASVALFTVSATEITHIWTRSVHEDPSIPALFLAWAPEGWFAHPKADGFAVTFSDGRTSVFTNDNDNDNDNDNEIKELDTFNAKQPIEIWFVALASFPTREPSKKTTSRSPYLFTGNDFGSLHTRRFEAITTHPEPSREEPHLETTVVLPPVILNVDDRARHHTAGVTSILPLPLPLTDGAPWVLTGSYDEYLRVYHAKRAGAVLAEMCLGGGVWRLQLLRGVAGVDGAGWDFLVLASCMHAGVRVVRVTWEVEGGEPRAGIEVLAEFTEHESMNYASDVWRRPGYSDLEGGEGGSELCVVSSSFYDRRVCVWRATV